MVKHKDPSNGVPNCIGAPPTTGGPWTLFHDQQERAYWVNMAGQAFYPAAIDSVQQTRQQPVQWIAPSQRPFPQVMQAPYLGPVVYTADAEGEWERFTDASGKPVWIHSTTDMVVYNNPYRK